MKKFRQALSLLLALLMLLCTFTACASGGSDTDGTNDGASASAEKLLVSNLSKYSLIVPEGGASDELADALNDLLMLLDERWGVSLGFREDVIIEGTEYVEGQYEIVVGETNRKESAEVLSDIKKYNDYEVRICGDKLVIAGMNEDQLAVAVQTVVDKIKTLTDDSEYFFDRSMQFDFQDTYDVGELLIGDTDISEYTIVYKYGDVGKFFADTVAEKILKKTGYRLKVVTDENVSDSDKKILVGDTKFGTPDEGDAEGYYVGSDENNVYLYAEISPSIYKAVTHFTNLLEYADGEKATLDLDLGFIVAEDTSLTTMSFNVKVANSTSTAYHNRVVTMIKKYMPDTLGVQEANSSWMTALNNALKDTYAYVGIGRDNNGKGEGCQIFYKKDKFNLLESGTKWLSDTPDKQSAYSGSACYRIFTYALLERKSDGKQFLHINTHLDHLATDEVKLKQAKVVTNFVKSYNKNVPMILTGDFNCSVGSLAGKNILSSGFDDASAAVIGSTGSMGGIDIIFTSKNDFTVYEVTRDGSSINGAAPSDHAPVIAKYDFK